MDLRDFPSPRNTWRRLFVLVSNLPPNSATVLSMTGGASAWQASEHLLATAVDALHAANWQRGAKKGSPRPQRIPRPGEKDEGADRIGGDTKYTVAEIDELLNAEWVDVTDEDTDEGGT